jgi:hypothetical protein
LGGNLHYAIKWSERDHRGFLGSTGRILKQAHSFAPTCIFLNFCYMPNFRKVSEAEIQTEALSPALPKLARNVKVRSAMMMAFYS